jgi:hypothetical protein
MAERKKRGLCAVRLGFECAPQSVTGGGRYSSNSLNRTQRTHHHARIDASEEFATSAVNAETSAFGGQSIRESVAEAQVQGSNLATDRSSSLVHARVG